MEEDVLLKEEMEKHRVQGISTQGKKREVQHVGHSFVTYSSVKRIELHRKEL